MRILAGLLSVFLLGAPASANVAPPPVDAPEWAAQTVGAFFENFNAGSVEGIASTYSDSGNFVWVENGAVVYSDKAAAVAGMKERLAATPGSRIEAINGFQIVPAAPGAAEVVAPITLYVKDAKSGEEKAMLSGIMTLLLAFENGEWRIVSGHTSTAVSMR